jgi:hypothetical protein
MNTNTKKVTLETFNPENQQMFKATPLILIVLTSPFTMKYI